MPELFSIQSGAFGCLPLLRNQSAQNQSAFVVLGKIETNARIVSFSVAAGK